MQDDPPVPTRKAYKEYLSGYQSELKKHLEYENEKKKNNKTDWSAYS